MTVKIGEADLFQGNCIEMMQQLPENSIDSVITDPPYGLNFMGKEWDHGVPGEPFWKEALRVAKPGAILLAFGGTRTFHHLACAIEKSGWEIRDCLMWLYGTGFPKGVNISRAIDAAAGAERPVIGKKDCVPGLHYRTSTGANNFTDDSWQGDDEKAQAITGPATEDAKLWNGWHTALKPAWEPIILAMKPREGTHAANAIKHGVAGLNIDGARISLGKNEDVEKLNAKNSNTGGFGAGQNCYGDVKVPSGCDPKGRFPTNVILDSEAASLLDNQSGVSKSTGGSTNNALRSDQKIFGKGKNNKVSTDGGYGDVGGASRFFYCAKASTSERGGGNNHPTVKPLKLMQYLCRLTKTPTGGIVLDPFMGSGTTGIAAFLEGRRFIGIELDKAYFDIAVNRIKENTVPVE